MKYDGNNIEDWYRDEMEHIRKDPDPEIWNRLENDLDVSNIWSLLNRRLDAWYRWLWWRRLALHVAGIALTATVGYFVVNSWSSDQYSRMGADEGGGTPMNESRVAGGQTSPLTREDKNTLSNHPQPETDSGSGISHATPVESSIGNPDLPGSALTMRGIDLSADHDQNSGVGGEVRHVKKTPLVSGENSNFANRSEISMDASNGVLKRPVHRELPAKMPLFPMRVERKERLDLWSKRYFLKEAPPIVMHEDAKGTSHWMVGVVAGVHNQWIISPETGNMIKSNEDRVVSDWGFSSGLSTVYMFNNRYSIETDLYAYSTSGIQFMDRRELQEVLRRYHFNYRKLSALVRIQTSPSNVRPMLNAVVVAGVYAGLLDNATLTEDGVKTDISDQYHMADVGITAGYHIDFHMRSRFALSPGIRVNQSVINNFSGTTSKPAYFNRTYHTNAGVSLNFLYKF